jgi:peptide/nickel transport system substrate-binding protein
VGALVGVVMAAFGESAAGQARHGIAMHGEPALPSDFRVLRYANPAAPKGGRLIQGVLGTFDSLNPLIVTGLVLSQIRGYVIESLLARNYDEPFSLYGLLARTVETDADRSYDNPDQQLNIQITGRSTSTASSWQPLREAGATAREIAARAPRRGGSRRRGSRARRDPPRPSGRAATYGELVRRRRAAFDETTLSLNRQRALCGGRSRRSITLAQSQYWGRDLPINRGQWNFDEIVDYYRCECAVRGFKKGLHDVRLELDPLLGDRLRFPSGAEGRVIKDLSRTVAKGDVWSRSIRDDRFCRCAVREAMRLLFDFEWVNQNLYFGRYRRTGSYFDGSELSCGRPLWRDARCSPFPN